MSARKMTIDDMKILGDICREAVKSRIEDIAKEHPSLRDFATLRDEIKHLQAEVTQLSIYLSNLQSSVITLFNKVIGDNKNEIANNKSTGVSEPQ